MSNLNNRVKILEGKISVSTARGERSFIILHSIGGLIDISYSGTMLKNGKYLDEHLPNAKRLTPEVFEEYRNQYFDNDDIEVNVIPASQMLKKSNQ